ncbi:MAG: hypothetical protein D6712_14640 [Chloroflexi bacterium]|nr:MAG: hypothetical protein D6712_14640 [Chloroflexota bacterium]
MTEISPEDSNVQILVDNPTASEWKRNTYMFGAFLGAVFGILAAYFYARAAEEEVQRTGRKSAVPTRQILGLGVSALTLIRQITEMGKSK